MCRRSDIGYQLTHSRPAVVLTDAEFAPLVDEVLPEGMRRLTYGDELDAAERPADR